MSPAEKKIIELAQNSVQESRQVDFKAYFDPNSSTDWSEITKDIIAMANSGGGVLIFGINDDSTYSNFDLNLISNIDPAIICDKIYSYTKENFSEFKIMKIKRNRKTVSAIVVGEAECPIVFTRNGADAIVNGKQKPVFLKGTLYIRHGAKSEPADTSDIRKTISGILNETRKSWFEGVRQISKIGPDDAVIISKKNPALGNNPLTLAGVLKVSEGGTPVRLSHAEFEKLMQEYPLEYKDVLIRLKKKRPLAQEKLQAYINSCKNNQDLSINWRDIGKSLQLPFPVSNKHMYKEKVVEDF